MRKMMDKATMTMYKPDFIELQVSVRLAPLGPIGSPIYRFASDFNIVELFD
jgi:hypothetical protein